MRMIQLLPTLAYGDAVGNDTLAIDKILREMGVKTQIYAEHIGARVPRGVVRPVADMPELQNDDLVIYHASTGTELNEKLPKMGGKKVMIYHNITPASFFHDYSPEAERLTQDGLKQFQRLAEHVEYCIADSEYNRDELLRMGYNCPIDVCPILIPFSDYEKEPSKKIVDQYSDGYTNLLFVGRIAPNKKQENVIRAFYLYHKHINPKSRLFLVGSWTGMEVYYERLMHYVRSLEIEDSVVFSGHVSFSDILAYYRVSHAFLCMSEHEGFCVPLVEAMHFRLPIVAYGTTAIPDTLGGSGVLLSSNDPVEAAVAVHRVIRDQAWREEVLKGQDRRLADFQYATVRARLEKLLEKAQAPVHERKPRINQLVTGISRGDAVGNDVTAFQQTMISMGYPSVIYTETQPNGKGWEMIQMLSQMPTQTADDVAMYHLATGGNITRQFEKLPCKKVVVYHNVTPPRFFAPYDQVSAKACEWGLQDAKRLSGSADRAIADSQFNKEDLIAMGYKAPIDVCPVVIPFDDYKQAPDVHTMEKYSDGRTNILFVGRVAPNKRFEDIISAFAAYKKKDASARLILAGSYDENGGYYKFLRMHVEQLGVEDVIFTGHTSFANILAYYRVADVFLCMSEHEGFCVPLLEAMFFDLPVVAYASTAVPGTLDGSGVMLNSKEPETVAAAMERLVNDQAWRDEIINGQRERLKYFSHENTEKILKKIVRSLVEEKA